MLRPRPNIARLIVSCPDQPGIVASLSGCLTESTANIVSSYQYSSDPEGGAFFLRMECYLERLATRFADIEERLADVASRIEMDWRLTIVDQPRRVGIFASRSEHCVLDLLWRWRRHELNMDVVAVVSNHAELESEVAPFGVAFHHIPVARDTKPESERRALDLLAGNVDVVILARYMQILSGDFLRRIGAPVINIHHSFLPAFAGADPYTRAYERGVKLIGATAHYATEDLDEGPIIEQDVSRVSHRLDQAELARIGRDIERVVLARAVHWHVDDRVFVHGNRTVVFQ